MPIMRSRARHRKLATSSARISFVSSVFVAAAQTPPLTTTLPPIEVTAQKEPQDPANLPISVTAVVNETLTAGALTSVSQAGWFAPNTFFARQTEEYVSKPAWSMKMASRGTSWASR